MLEAAFVAWLVALFGDRAVRGVTRVALGNPDRRRLSQGLAAASRTAIAAIMDDVPPESREPLRLVLAEQFNRPPAIPLDGRTRVRTGLIQSIRQQIAPLSDPDYTPSGISYFETISVDGDRLSDELTHIAIRAIEQVGPQFPGLTPLITQLNADALAEQLEYLSEKEQTTLEKVEYIIAGLEQSRQHPWTTPDGSAKRQPRPAVPAATAADDRGDNRTFPPDTEDRLVDTLLSVPSVIDDDSRSQILNKLPGSLRDSIPRIRIPRIQLYAIVQTSLNYPNGFRDLVRAIRSFERDSLPMRQLDKVILEVGGQTVCDPSGSDEGTGGE